jgi:hypothetical protein
MPPSMKLMIFSKHYQKEKRYFKGGTYKHLAHGSFFCKMWDWKLIWHFVINDECFVI